MTTSFEKWFSKQNFCQLEDPLYVARLAWKAALLASEAGPISKPVFPSGSVEGEGSNKKQVIKFGTWKIVDQEYN